MTQRHIPRAVLGALFGILPLLGHAQWVTQSIPLTPGWNAVFLQVQPQSSLPGALRLRLPRRAL